MTTTPARRAAEPVDMLVCTTCVMFLANGEASDYDDMTAIERADYDAAVAEFYRDPSVESVTLGATAERATEDGYDADDHGVTPFSSAPCGMCGTTLAGERHDAAVWCYTDAAAQVVTPPLTGVEKAARALVQDGPDHGGYVLADADDRARFSLVVRGTLEGASHGYANLSVQNADGDHYTVTADAASLEALGGALVALAEHVRAQAPAARA